MQVSKLIQNHSILGSFIDYLRFEYYLCGNKRKMKTSEVRQGNLIQTNKSRTQVVSVGIQTINRNAEWRYEGIPLADELLLKYGFYKLPPCKDFENITMPYLANNGVLLFYNKHRTEYETMDYFVGYAETRNGKYHVVLIQWIKYLHQLQNLYFALTGTELEIKL